VGSILTLFVIPAAYLSLSSKTSGRSLTNDPTSES
jgi:hypothetical protein